MDKKHSPSSKNRSKKKSSRLPKITDITSLSGYDIIDLGAGDGASLKNFERKFNGRGIGIELDEKKVKKAVALGHDNIYLGSALDLHKLSGKADYVTCDNFLEHLLSFDDVERMLRQAMGVARKCIYIRHPGFEDIDYLKSHGLKTYWSDWHGHTAMMRIGDYMEMFMRLGIQTVKVVPVSLIKDSEDDRLLPLDAPIDQHNYDPKKHSKKPKKIVFDREVYYAFDIVAMVPGADQHMPDLQYHDRLNATKHPKITMPEIIPPKEYRRLKKRYDEVNKKYELLRNRRSVRAAMKVGRSVRGVKGRINR